jgi:hypothetical protein
VILNQGSSEREMIERGAACAGSGGPVRIAGALTGS